MIFTNSTITYLTSLLNYQLSSMPCWKPGSITSCFLLRSEAWLFWKGHMMKISNGPLIVVLWPTWSTVSDAMVHFLGNINGTPSNVIYAKQCINGLKWYAHWYNYVFFSVLVRHWRFRLRIIYGQPQISCNAGVCLEFIYSWYTLVVVVWESLPRLPYWK